MSYSNIMAIQLPKLLFILSIFLLLPISYCAVGASSPPQDLTNSVQMTIDMMPDGRAAVHITATLPKEPENFSVYIGSDIGPVKSVLAGSLFSANASKIGTGTTIYYANVSGELQSTFYLLTPLKTVSGSGVYSFDLDTSFSRQFGPASIIVTPPIGSKLISTSGLQRPNSGNSSDSVVYLYSNAVAGQNLDSHLRIQSVSPGMFQFAQVTEPAPAPTDSTPAPSNSYQFSLSTPIMLPILGNVPAFSIIIVIAALLVGIFLVAKSFSWARSNSSSDDPDRPWSFDSPNIEPEQDPNVKVNDKPIQAQKNSIVARSFSDIRNGAISVQSNSQTQLSNSQKQKYEQTGKGVNPKDAEQAQSAPATTEKSNSQMQAVPSVNNSDEQIKEKPSLSQPAALSPVIAQKSQPVVAQPMQSTKQTAVVASTSQAQEIKKPALVPMPQTAVKAETSKPGSIFGFIPNIFAAKPAQANKSQLDKEQAAKLAGQKPSQALVQYQPTPSESEIILVAKKFRYGILLSRLRKYMIMKPADFKSSFDSVVSNGILEVIQKNGQAYVRMARKKPKPQDMAEDAKPADQVASAEPIAKAEKTKSNENAANAKPTNSNQIPSKKLPAKKEAKSAPKKETKTPAKKETKKQSKKSASRKK